MILRNVEVLKFIEYPIRMLNELGSFIYGFPCKDDHVIESDGVIEMRNRFVCCRDCGPRILFIKYISFEHLEEIGIGVRSRETAMKCSNVVPNRIHPLFRHNIDVRNSTMISRAATSLKNASCKTVKS